ncbi:MAG TPA: DNA translocase FtsK, partial [Anaerolineales bacterium]|nr:DNA translocase FtsK [Anaerolineales bacterium]
MRNEAPPAPSESSSRKKIAAPDPNFVRVVVLGNRLRKYADDLFALFLLVLAALTLFALTGLSSGTLLEPWSGILRQWFGWGALLVPISLGLVGGGILLHNLGRLAPVRWGRVIWGELAAFLLLALFNYANGGSVLLAAEGQGGGVVGWAIGFIFARVFAPADVLFVGVSFLVSLVLALDITANRIERGLKWLTSQGFAADPGQQLPLPLDEAEPETELRGRPSVLAEPAQPRAEKAERTKTERLKKVPVAVSNPEAKAKVKVKRDKRLPDLDLLDNLDLRRPAQREIDETAAIIVKTLAEFGVPVNVLGARVGPSVTQYQVEPGFVERPGVDGISKQWKVRVGQIASLQNDMALALSATTLRIEAPVPGQHYVGIEVPHRRTSVVGLRPVIESEAFQKIGAPLKLAIGRDVSGAAVAADLGKMPHMLIAGTTGSGKSVAITSMVASLILTNTPDDLRLVMIDPKMVELVRFNGVPHLLGKVETEVTRILGVLRWTVREMERRYKLFESYHVRNLDTYMAKAAKKLDIEKLPRVAVFIDELADLMMQAPDETERMVVRLAQMARATGIHLVVATQRPSVDVVTGLIKANFPA